MRNNISKRGLCYRPGACLFVLLAFLLNSFGPIPGSFAEPVYTPEGQFILPVPGSLVELSPSFDPPLLKGIKVDPDNPLKFEFVLDQGSPSISYKDGLGGSFLKKESTKLIKYFLASLTIPEDDLWVNLSPYEKDRIIPSSFGLTEMGRDLLAQDYILKQVVASLIYPQGQTGKIFWQHIYALATQRYGTTNIPLSTFNKVWIIPEKAVVYENARAGTAYVVESRLKVMLDEDYLALDKNTIRQPGDMSALPTRGHVPRESGYVYSSTLPSELGLNAPAPQGNPQTSNDNTNELGSQIVREIVIPELTKEVNEGKNFAQLRQVYNSLILAAWYKRKIKESLLSQVYAGKNKVAGILLPPGDLVGNPQAIYWRYVQAFKKGVFNYIKEEQDPLSKELIPRKYFSGGTNFDTRSMDAAMSISSDTKLLTSLNHGRMSAVEVDMQGVAGAPLQGVSANAGIRILSDMRGLGSTANVWEQIQEIHNGLDSALYKDDLKPEIIREALMGGETPYKYFIAVDQIKRRVMGYVVYLNHKRSMFVRYLAVDQSYQGQNTGTELMKAVFKKAYLSRKLSVDLGASAAAGNPAIGFYKSLPSRIRGIGLANAVNINSSIFFSFYFTSGAQAEYKSNSESADRAMVGLKPYLQSFESRMAFQRVANAVAVGAPLLFYDLFGRFIDNPSRGVLAVALGVGMIKAKRKLRNHLFNVTSTGRYILTYREAGDRLSIHIKFNKEQLKQKRFVAYKLIIKDIANVLREIIVDQDGHFDTINEIIISSPLLVKEHGSGAYAEFPVFISSLMNLLGVQGRVSRRGFFKSIKIVLMGAVIWGKNNRKWTGQFELDVSNQEKRKMLIEKLNRFIGSQGSSLRGLPSVADAAMQAEEIVKRFNALQGVRKVVDLGSHNGMFLDGYKKFHPQEAILGFEINPAKLDGSFVAQEGKELVIADARHTGLLDNSVDKVTFNYPVADPVLVRELLFEARRILKPGGEIDILTENPRLGIGSMLTGVFGFKIIAEGQLDKIQPDYPKTVFATQYFTDPKDQLFIKAQKNTDEAMVTPNKGGIDLTAAHMPLEIKADAAMGGPGSSVRFQVDPAMIAQLRDAAGFVPTIINIRPLADLGAFLGVKA